MIEYIKGDLFDTPHHIIVHGCNAQGVMGSGVAKIVREKHPYAYDDYIRVSKFQGLRLGQCIYSVSNHKLIVNAITQNNYGRDGSRYVDYEAVAKVMQHVNGVARDSDYGTIAMPKIGAGLGGGDWNVIEAIIKSECVDVNVVVYEL